MGYLIQKDFNKSIQADQLTQITTNDPSIIVDAENLAYETAIENLVQKYEIKAELVDTNIYDFAVSYKSGARVFLDYPIYSATSVGYNINELITFNGVCYICINNTAGAFDPAAWVAIGPRYQIFSAIAPVPAFSLKTYYTVGDPVFWKDNIYACAIATGTLDSEAAIQYGTINNLPLQNIFPDDVNFGRKYWGAPTPYSVPDGTLPTDTDFWLSGDSRCQRLVYALVAIVLKTIHERIAPRNIPDLRVKAFDDAMRWFTKCAKGEVTAQLTAIQPKSGARVRYGGQIKNQNHY